MQKATTVRLFVSSTFRDMHAERDHLNRKVFPEIASRCKKAGIGFSAIDLRWGITEEDARSLGAYVLCRDEICRCNLFVAILGDRYGWIPPPCEIPPDLYKHAADWCFYSSEDRLLANYRLDETSEPPVYRLLPTRKLDEATASSLITFWRKLGLADAGKSVTELEIRRGAIERKAALAASFFYFRATDFRDCPSFPAGLYDCFMEADPEKRKLLEELKRSLRSDFGAKACRDYSVTFAGHRVDPLYLPLGYDVAALSDGRIEPGERDKLPGEVLEAVECHGVVDYDGLLAWGEQVQTDLWDAITGCYLQRELTERDSPRSYHEIFQEEKCALFIGRVEFLRSMEQQLWDVQSREPLVLWGPPGSGKSTLIAELSRRATERQTDALIIPIYIGAAPGSTDINLLIHSIIELLRPFCSAKLVPSEDPQKLRYQLGTFLVEAAKQRNIILLLDAVNQLDTRESDRQLDWLPMEALPRVRIILTTLEGPCLAALQARIAAGNLAGNLVEIPALGEDERRGLVVEYLQRRGKKLSDPQMVALLDTSIRKDAVHPLYLVVALEELCLFGEYEALARRIEALPPAMTELFDSVLRRLEQDHGRDLTEQVLQALAVSRSGLLESEIRGLFHTCKFWGTLQWKCFYRALEPYLRPMDETTGEGLIAFFHDQLRFAVFRKYLAMPSVQALPSEPYRSTHSSLARFFTGKARSARQGWLSSQLRALSELPYHLAGAGEQGTLRSLLLDFSWLLAKTRGKLGVFAVNADFGKVDDPLLQLVSDALRLSTGIILKGPEYLAPQLIGRLLGHSDPEIRALLDSIPVKADAPWLCPLLPGLLPADGAVRNVFDSHPNPVNAVVLTPEGQTRAVSCAEDGTVRVWDLASGAEIRMLDIAPDTMLDDAPKMKILCVSTDGRRIAAGAEGGMICIWDAETGEVLHQRQNHEKCVTGIVLTGGDRLLSVAKDGRVKRWQITSEGLELLTEWDHFSPVNCLSVSCDGNSAVTGADDGIAKLWDLWAVQWRRDLPHSGRAVLDAAFLADGSVCCALADGSLSMWPAGDGPALSFAGRHDAAATCIDVATESGRIVTGSDDRTLRLWGEGTLQCEKVLRGHSFKIRDLAVSKDGTFAVSASEDTTLMVWDLAGEHPMYDPVGHAELITAVAFAPDGLRVMTGANDGELKLWDIATQKEIVDFSGRGAHAAPVEEIAFIGGKGVAVSFSLDRALRYWHFGGERAPATLASEMPDFLAFSLGGYSFNVAGAGPVGSILRSDEGGQAPFTAEKIAVASDANGSFLVFTCKHEVWSYDLPDGPGRCLGRHEDDVKSVAIFPDGNTIASAGRDRKIKIWSRRDARCMHELCDHDREVWKIRITPDGTRGVSASDDRSVILWDMIGFRKIAQFFLDGAVVACDISPDGSTVVTGDEAGRLVILKLVLPVRKARLSGRFGRGRPAELPRRLKRRCRLAGTFSPLIA